MFLFKVLRSYDLQNLFDVMFSNVGYFARDVCRLCCSHKLSVSYFSAFGFKTEVQYFCVVPSNKIQTIVCTELKFKDKLVFKSLVKMLCSKDF